MAISRAFPLIRPWAFTGAKTRKAIGTKGPTTASSSSAASNASRKPAAFASEKKSAGRRHEQSPKNMQIFQKKLEKPMNL